MDAVQRANSGHPGLPLAMAPAAYVLFARVMKHDPADPGLARPRPLRALGRPRVDAPVLGPAPGRLRPPAGRARALPPVGLAHARAPRALVLRHRDDDRAAGAGIRQRRRDGHGRALPARPLRRRRLRSPRLRALLRRRPDGGRQRRGRLAGRAPRPGAARLPLRRQPDHDRRPHRPRLRDRRRRGPLRGLRLAHVAVDDANDVDALETAMLAARAEEDRPSLVRVRSVIGWPAPTKAGTAKAHGAPLGAEEVAATKRRLGCDPDASFAVPAEARDAFADARERGAVAREAWNGRQALAGVRPGGGARMGCARGAATAAPTWRSGCRTSGTTRSPRARRAARPCRRSPPCVPTMVGGAADLVESTKTRFDGEDGYTRAAPDATCTGACASTRWGRRSTDWRCTAASSSPTARPSSSSPTTCAPPSGCPRSSACRWSGSSPTTRSASARTARRTSRSSTWPRCAPSRISS